MEWSREKTLEFIAAYRSFAVLWDCKEEFYKDRYKRHEALEALAQKFGTLTTEVERKIKNLQSHFLRERKRLIASKKNTSTWFAYKPLLFLLTRNNKSENRPRLKTETTSTPKTAPVIESTKTQPRVQPVAQNASCSGIKETPMPSLQPILPDSYSTMKEIFKCFKERDEFDLYGEQVAIKLRNISSPLARVTVQNRMNMLLVQAELGMLDTESEYASPSVEFCPLTKVEIVEPQ